MSSDLRFMKCPRQTWFFVYSIPKDLRGHPRFMTSRGQPMDKITESLGTKDPDAARQRRNERVVYWDRQFRILRSGPNEDDIRAAAAEVYLAERRKLEEQDQEYRQPFTDARNDGIIEQMAAHEVAAFCERTGFMLKPGTPEYRRIGLEFVKAKAAAGNELVAMPGIHEPIPPPAPAEPKPIMAPPMPKKGAETFADAAAIYLRTELKDDVKPATVAEYKRKIAAFPHKDKPLRAIARGTAADFLDGLKVSKRTRNLYAALYSAIYKSAIRRERASVNPFADQRVNGVGRVHYEPFTDEEVGKLFAKTPPTPALFWAMRIAAYTGCRREEIAGLMRDDIKRTDGVWYFDIRNGKTDNAVRVVPMHSRLIKAGLLTYVKASAGRLFPGLKPRASKDGKFGAGLGDAFEAWRKRLGIVRPGVNFHSFRHCVGDRLRKAGIAREDIAAVLGHATGDVTTRVYGHRGPGLKRLAAVVEEISYEG
jgi:integrase